MTVITNAATCTRVEVVRSASLPGTTAPTDDDLALLTFLRSNGYSEFRRFDGLCCGLQSFLYTTGLTVGLTWEGYERRYCYESAEDAAAALAAWDGRGHPAGAWIKVKGFLQGEPIDLLNPSLDD